MKHTQLYENTVFSKGIQTAFRLIVIQGLWIEPDDPRKDRLTVLSSRPRTSCAARAERSNERK
ncbi:MAG: hypothetical protein ACYS80_05545 [Planctomycetota bacterium]